MERKRYTANWNKEKGWENESTKHIVEMKGREHRNWQDRNLKDDAQQYNLPN